MTTQFLSALIVKEAVLIEWFWGFAVCGDIELEKLTGFGFKLDKSISIALS